MAKNQTPRSSSNNRPVPLLEPRIATFTVLMFVIFAVVSVRLYYLQVLHNQENVELADRNRIRLQRVPAPRGLVFDRNHRPLVDTKPSFDAQIVPEDSDNLSLTIERLERYTGAEDIPDKISDADEEGRPPYEPITVAERLGWQQVVALETHQLELPGVSLQITPARHYLYGELAAHLLGYVGEVTKADLQEHEDYHMGDEIGNSVSSACGKIFCAATRAVKRSKSTRSGGGCACSRKLPTSPAKASS
ncbi:MAG: hypothetical protein WBY93_22050 [Candidatus Binatus sp.]